MAMIKSGEASVGRQAARLGVAALAQGGGIAGRRHQLGDRDGRAVGAVYGVPVNKQSYVYQGGLL